MAGETRYYVQVRSKKSVASCVYNGRSPSNGRQFDMQLPRLKKGLGWTCATKMNSLALYWFAIEGRKS